MKQGINHLVINSTYKGNRIGGQGMAMSFSLVGLRAKGIKIKNPHCVAKTFPDYFDELKKLCRAV